LLLAGNPARQHDFALSMPSSAGWWRVAEETPKIGQRLGVLGSLLALDRALGRDWLRPISYDVPEIGRRMTPEDMRGFGEAVAALNPFRLTDDARDAIVSSVRRGRDRIGAAASASALDALAAQAGVDGQRRRLIRWTAARDPSAASRYFALVEVLRVGAGEPSAVEPAGWGLPTRVFDGSLDVAMPRVLGWQQLSGRPAAPTAVMPACVVDLQLHVAEVLAQLRLPAALTPAVLSFAGWDMVMSAAMTDRDDWFAVIEAAQSLPADRIADYVSALTADGPLVPVDVK
jgi:hypothetical protein